MLCYLETICHYIIYLWYSTLEVCKFFVWKHALLIYVKVILSLSDSTLFLSPSLLFFSLKMLVNGCGTLSNAVGLYSTQILYQAKEQTPRYNLKSMNQIFENIYPLIHYHCLRWTFNNCLSKVKRSRIKLFKRSRSQDITYNFFFYSMHQIKTLIFWKRFQNPRSS